MIFHHSSLQAHKHGVCHGDIKMENVMVTSWNWVMLTDFSATFKPTALPEDNPADFSYFFDTSRRRTCYIAPERFRTRNVHSTPSGTNLATDVTDSTTSSSSATTSAYDAVVQGLDSVAKFCWWLSSNPTLSS